MRIILDVDGVCADLMGALRNEIGPQFPACVTQWDFRGLLGAEEREYAGFLMERANFWDGIPLMPGARECVDKLRVHHDVVFATSPWDSCPGWHSTRNAWLWRNLSVRSGDVVFTARKDLVAGDVFLDDKPENVLAWMGAGHGEGYLFAASYNHHDDIACHRRVDWGGFMAEVKKLEAR